jgi:hypothetical protein
MTETLTKPRFLEFKVRNEPWNECKLEDGSTLRVKVVLTGLLKEDGTVFSLQTNNVIGVVPNSKYMGLPSPPLKPGEKLESYIEAEDLTILEQTDFWNEYEILSEHMLLKIKGAVVKVSRTSRRDERGIPIYIANIQPLIKHKKEAKVAIEST